MKKTLDDARVAEKSAADRCHAADEARSVGEAELLAAELECEVCETGCAFLSKGGEVQFDAAELQRVAAKLKLEESLVLMLPCMARKTFGERTALEQMASNLLSEAIGRHAAELRKHCETERNASVGRAAEVDDLRKLHEGAQNCSRLHAEALEDARKKASKADANLVSAMTARDECTMEMAQLEKVGVAAHSELLKYRDGPYAAFKALLSSKE